MTHIKSLVAVTRGPLLGVVLGSDGGEIESLKFVTNSGQMEALLLEYVPDGIDLELHVQAHKQIKEYFTGDLRAFDLPLNLKGTEFQRQVWQAIASIPYGQVRTYGQLAATLGSSRLSRAVGQAANSNPIPLIVPCHRVVGRNGKLTGFASGIELKSSLLSHERRDLLWE